jgi:Rrf2 family iron-sulfur cluster assembly transcriptional regulator
MRFLPRSALLALMATLDVAIYARIRPVSSKALAARNDLPPRHLEGMLQALVRAGVLKSVRGPYGGYELARERRRVCVGEIVRVAMRADDGDGESAKSPGLLETVLRPMIDEVEEFALTRLDGVSLDDLHARALAAGFGEKDETHGSFEI